MLSQILKFKGQFCKIFSPFYPVYKSIQTWRKLQHANGSLSLGQYITITIPVYPIEVFPVSTTRTWAICSVSSAVPSCLVLCCAVLCCSVMFYAVICCAVIFCAVLCCAVLCCAVWDSTMRHCKAVPQCTPYKFS